MDWEKAVLLTVVSKATNQTPLCPDFTTDRCHPLNWEGPALRVQQFSLQYHPVWIWPRTLASRWWRCWQKKKRRLKTWGNSWMTGMIILHTGLMLLLPSPNHPPGMNQFSIQTTFQVNRFKGISIRIEYAPNIFEGSSSNEKDDSWKNRCVKKIMDANASGNSQLFISSNFLRNESKKCISLWKGKTLWKIYFFVFDHNYQIIAVISFHAQAKVENKFSRKENLNYKTEKFTRSIWWNPCYFLYSRRHWLHKMPTSKQLKTLRFFWFQRF